MNNTKNLKILLAVLASLVIAVVVYNIMKSGKKASSYDPQIVAADTNTVTKISITPKAGAPAFDVEKVSGQWTIKAEGKQFPADDRSIINMLTQLENVKAQRVASTKKTSWEKYEITDSAATRIQLYESENLIADLYLGKFSFKQSQNPYQKQPDITSYVRRSGDDRVYATSGMLSMAFNRQYNDLRNQNIVQVTPESIASVTMYYEGSNYDLKKDELGWTVAGVPADSMKVAQYINGLRSVRHRQFADDVTVNGLVKVANVAIAIESGETITVSAYDSGAGQFYIQSDQNSASVFACDSTGAFQQLFKSAGEFIQAIP